MSNTQHFLIGSGAQPASEPLTSTESETLAASLEALSSVFVNQYRSLANLLLDYTADIQAATEYTKAAFNLEFGGVLPQGTQFGIRPIRALTVTAPTTGSMYWTQSISSGWNTLFSVNLNYAGSTGKPATQLQNNYAMLIIGLLDPTTNEHFDEEQLSVLGNTYPVIPFTATQISDLFYIPFPGVIYVGMNQTATVQVNSNANITTNVRLFGVEFYKRTVGLSQD